MGRAKLQYARKSTGECSSPAANLLQRLTYHPGGKTLSRPGITLDKQMATKSPSKTIIVSRPLLPRTWLVLFLIPIIYTL